MTTVPVRARVSGSQTVATVVAGIVIALLAAAGQAARRARAAVSPVLDLAGLTAIVTGAFMLVTWLGWVVLGVALLVLSMRADASPAGSDG